MNKIHLKPIIQCLFALLLALPLGTATAQDAEEAQQLVVQAQASLNNFVNDPNTGAFRNYLKTAKGVLMIPSTMEAGFVITGSGGNGVLLVRDKETGAWSYPAFYSFGTGGIGLSAGVKVSEVGVLVMTDKGVNSLLSSSLKMGVGASIAAGPVGAAAAAVTTDMVAYSRSKGVFGGLSLDGAVVSPLEAFNKAYYGKDDITPVDILVKHDVTNPNADALRTAINQAAAGK